MDHEGKRLQKIEEELEAKLDRFDREIEERLARTEARIKKVFGEKSAKPLFPADSSQTRPREKKWTQTDFLARVDLNQTGNLRVVDDLMEGDFQLTNHFDNSIHRYPTIYCETLEEFFQPHVEFLEASVSAKEALLENLRQEAEEMAPQGGIYGVNWPGKGCYLNGWLFAYGKAKDARVALNDPAIFSHIVATAAHEKLGHGFITEFTASGAEKKQVHLWQYEVAEKFHIKLSDSPRATLLREKWNILLGSSLYVEEGWSTWIENYIMERLGALDHFTQPDHTPARAYTLDRVQEVLQSLSKDNEQPWTVREAARRYNQLLQGLLTDTLSEAEEIHQAVLELTIRLDGIISPSFQFHLGQSPRYVVGYLFMQKLASKYGTLCVPYAVASASNIRYEIEQIANPDLARLIQHEPPLNINTRFALLTSMTPEQKNTIIPFLRQARDELGFAPPFVLEEERS